MHSIYDTTLGVERPSYIRFATLEEANFANVPEHVGQAKHVKLSRFPDTSGQQDKTQQ